MDSVQQIYATNQTPLSQTFRASLRSYRLELLQHRTWLLDWHKGLNDRAYFAWPSRLPDLTPCNFYLLGFIKNHLYVPQLSADLPDLRNRIEEVVATITADTLIKVWNEFAHRHVWWMVLTLNTCNKNSLSSSFIWCIIYNHMLNVVGWLVSNIEHLTMKSFALLHSSI